MYHDVNQVKVLFEDVRDMYDEDTYQAISVLIDKYLTTGYLSKDEQRVMVDLMQKEKWAKFKKKLIRATN